MPSVYNYRHVELDKVGRGKRVIQPPGGQTADIFGRSTYEQNFSSASSQAGSDVGSSRVHIETDQQSIASSSNQTPVDGLMTQHQQQQMGDGQMSPSGSIGSSSASINNQGGQQQLLMTDAYKPMQQEMINSQQVAVGQQQQQQQQVAMSAQDARTPKKTIPVLRRNPITGEILGAPGDRQPAVVRVRQPPGGRSSGIF